MDIASMEGNVLSLLSYNRAPLCASGPNGSALIPGRHRKFFCPLNITIVLRFFFSEYTLLNP